MATRYGDTGEPIKQLQRNLLANGYALPQYGADGFLGDETWNALRAFSKDRGLGWTPEVPPAVMSALALPPVQVVDLTALQSNPPHASSKFKLDSTGKVVTRDPRTITGIVLHQTACWYGVSSSQIAASGGDKHAALHARSLEVACHLIAFDGKSAGLDCGHTVQPNPLDWYVYHANTANNLAIGVECEGVYPGLVVQGGVAPSARLVQAARDAVRAAVEQGRAAGMPIEFIWAHRQSSLSRRADPGESLWRSVVLEYAVPVLGLRTETARTWGDGLPIPVQWDPFGVGSY